MITNRDRVRGYSNKKEINDFFAIGGPYDKAWKEMMAERDQATDAERSRCMLYFMLGTTAYPAGAFNARIHHIIERTKQNPAYGAMFAALEKISTSFIPDVPHSVAQDLDFPRGSFLHKKEGHHTYNRVAITLNNRIYHVKRIYEVSDQINPGVPANTEHQKYIMMAVILKYIRLAWIMHQMKHISKQIPLYMLPSKIHKGAVLAKVRNVAPTFIYTFRQIENASKLSEYMNHNIMTAGMLFEMLIAKWALVKYANAVMIDDHNGNIMIREGCPPRPYRVAGEHFIVSGPMPILIDPDDFVIANDQWTDKDGLLVANGKKKIQQLTGETDEELKRIKSLFQVVLETYYRRNKIEGRILSVVETLIQPANNTMDVLTKQIELLVEILTGRTPRGDVAIKIRISP